MKLLLSSQTFSVHHTTMHQFTVSTGSVLLLAEGTDSKLSSRLRKRKINNNKTSDSTLITTTNVRPDITVLVDRTKTKQQNQTTTFCIVFRDMMLTIGMWPVPPQSGLALCKLVFYAQSTSAVYIKAILALWSHVKMKGGKLATRPEIDVGIATYR